MATNIVRGGTCRLCFYPQNGLRVENLGTPTIAISQELTFLTPDVVVDTENNRVYADLTESDTIQLVENLDTKVQVAYTDDTTETVYRFPVHNVTVSDSLFENFFGEEEDEEEEGEEPGQEEE